MKIDALVENYILLRDRKAALKAKYDESVAEIDGVLDKIEARLLGTFQDSGIDSIKTPLGTAFRSSRTSATVADWDVFFGHVKHHEAWELLEHRCNKTAVEQYKAANEDIPPGVNWREEMTVNIRRPKTRTN